jgi:hypothetical protein
MNVPHASGDSSAVRKLGLGLMELALVSGLYAVYRLGRLLTADRTSTARAHARLVHHLEAVLRLPSEAAIQHAVQSTRLLEAANLYYLGAHFPVTIAFLVGVSLGAQAAGGPHAARPGGAHRLPARPAPHVPQVGLPRHDDDLRPLGVRRGQRRARQPVRRHAEPAHRLGRAHRAGRLADRAQAARGPGLPARTGDRGGGHRHRQPLAPRRSRRRRTARGRAAAGPASEQRPTCSPSGTAARPRGSPRPRSRPGWPSGPAPRTGRHRAPSHRASRRSGA